MADPILTTMLAVEDAHSVQQIELLSSGLESGVPRIEEICSQALLRLGMPQALIALITAAGHASQILGEKVRANADVLSGTFRQMLLHGTTEQKLAALKTIEVTETFEPGPVVVELIRNTSQGPVFDQGVKTLREMAWQLYELSESGTEKRLYPTLSALAGIYRPRVVDAISKGLELDLDHLADGKEYVRELFVECLMIIARTDSAEVRRVLWSANPSIRDVVRRLMKTGTHPGILRTIFGSLTYGYPHPRALDAVQERVDLEFIIELLKTVTDSASSRLLQNLRQVTYISWLSASPFDLTWLPVQFQPAVIQLLNCTGVNRDCRRKVEDWLLEFGIGEGREAAAHSAARYDDEIVKKVVRKSLDSQDMEVAAWACTQLKVHQFPDAARLLIEKLRSPNDEMREVARRELKSWFQVQRMLDLNESMTSEIGIAAGKILLEIDETAIATFEAELQHPGRYRRLRALKTIDKLGLESSLQPNIMVLLADVDPLIRRTIVDLLLKIPTVDSVLGLQYLCKDSSVRVQDAASFALQRIARDQEAMKAQNAAGPGNLQEPSPALRELYAGSSSERGGRIDPIKDHSVIEDWFSQVAAEGNRQDQRRGADDR